jgi:hypothetical protein
MKTCGIGLINPGFLTSAPAVGEWSVLGPGALFPREEPPVTTGQEAEWAPEPVWTSWRKEILDPTGIRNQILPRMASSGMLRRVARVRTDVSE